MPNPFFQFKQFTVYHDRCAMKVTTDACLFGAWCARELQSVAGAQVLDIGAGTGLLTLLVAQKTGALIHAVEIDADAATQATANVAASPWANRIRIITADLREWEPPHRFDAIISNPPFYQHDLVSPSAKKNLAHHQAGLPLNSVIAFAAEALSPQGELFLLLPAKREKELPALLQQHSLVCRKLVRVQQTPRHHPFRLMLTIGRKAVDETVAATLIIKGDDDAYTPEFVALLRDYYLHLQAAY